MIWGGDEMLKTNIINKTKHPFQFGCEEIETFTYTGIELVQDSGFGISINQNNYISSIIEIVLQIDGTKDKTSSLSYEVKKLHRSAVSQLNWVAGIFKTLHLLFSV